MPEGTNKLRADAGQVEAWKAIWTPQDLADYLQVKIGWVYARSRMIPRCPGIKRLRFNTSSPEFQGWLEQTIGHSVDYTPATK